MGKNNLLLIHVSCCVAVLFCFVLYSSFFLLLLFRFVYFAKDDAIGQMGAYGSPFPFLQYEVDHNSHSSMQPHRTIIVCHDP